MSLPCAGFRGRLLAEQIIVEHATDVQKAKTYVHVQSAAYCPAIRYVVYWVVLMRLDADFSVRSRPVRPVDVSEEAQGGLQTSARF